MAENAHAAKEPPGALGVIPSYLEGLHRHRDEHANVGATAAQRQKRSACSEESALHSTISPLANTVAEHVDEEPLPAGHMPEPASHQKAGHANGVRVAEDAGDAVRRARRIDIFG